jgi:hypothetical protein
VDLIELGGDVVVVLRNCRVGFTRCDVWVLTGSFTKIATDVTILRAFAIAPSLAQPVGAFLLWDATGNGLPDGGAILIDRNGNGDFGDDGLFGESLEIRVFGRGLATE